MPGSRSNSQAREIAVRVVADTVIIILTVLTAVILRFFYMLAFQSFNMDGPPRQVITNYLTDFVNSIWLLTPICLAVFAFKGMYTHIRSYRIRYKVLLTIQAITLSYLLFGFLSYFIGGSLALPRSVIVLAWVLNISTLVMARLWSPFIEWIMRPERRPRVKTVPPQAPMVLVIGGAGYIGSALLPKLLDQGYRVRLLDLLMYGTDPIKDLLNHPRLEILQADFRQVDKVVEAMKGVDTVIHLGAIVGDPACALNEELTIEVNLVATRMIAEIAKGWGIKRFIFASTCSVYGASDEVLDERSALNPVSLYARSKIASERVLAEMADESFAPVILRFGTIYGLSGRTRFDLVINLLTAMAVVDNKITVFGGDQWRPFVHVDDAALAVFKALEAPLEVVRNQVFNVGSKEQNYTIQQVGEIIHQMVPGAELISKGTDGDRRNYRVNFNKILNTLNFEPQWTVEQGVSQVIEAIQSGLVKDYNEARYSNVKFLKEENTPLSTRNLNIWARKLLDEVTPELEKEKVAS